MGLRIKMKKYMLYCLVVLIESLISASILYVFSMLMIAERFKNLSFHECIMFVCMVETATQITKWETFKDWK